MGRLICDEIDRSRGWSFPREFSRSVKNILWFGSPLPHPNACLRHFLVSRFSLEIVKISKIYVYSYITVPYFIKKYYIIRDDKKKTPNEHDKPTDSIHHFPFIQKEFFKKIFPIQKNLILKTWIFFLFFLICSLPDDKWFSFN